MRVFRGLICAALSLFSAASGAQMRAHFIDVGQGAATLVEFPCGCALVDTGGEENAKFHSTPALLSYLDGFFAKRTDLHTTLDLLLLTHPHIDHTRGAVEVWNHYTVRNLVTNGATQNASGLAQQRAVEKFAGDNSHVSDHGGLAAVHLADVPDETGLTNATIDPVNCAGIDPRITALWGSLDDAADWKAADFKNANNGSVVIRIDYGASSMLIQGDLEDVAIKKLLAKYSHSSLLDVDVYHVGHHGSKNGTTDELLSALSPQMAVIASGDVSRELQWTAWAYGHPNAGIISLLQSHVSAERPSVVTVDAGDGAKKFHHVKIQKDIFDTAWDGSFILETKGDGKWIEVGPSPDSGARININTASEDELKTLPGIGGVRARSILKYREHHGNFASIEDLLKVDGIGPATLNGLREKVVLE